MGEDREAILSLLREMLSGGDLSARWEEILVTPLRDVLRQEGGRCLRLFTMGLLSALLPGWISRSDLSQYASRMLGAACAALLASSMAEAVWMCQRLLTRLLVFLEGAQSVLTALAVLTGAAQTSAAILSGSSFFFTLFNRVLQEGIFPLWMAILFLRLTELFVANPLPGRLADFGQRLNVWGMALGCGCAVALMKAQMGFALAADTWTRRSLRTAVEQSFPVIGSSLRDMVDTTLLSAGLLQNALGGLSILALLLVVGPPACQLFAGWLGIELGSLGAPEEMGEKMRRLASLQLLALGTLILVLFWVLFCLGQIVNAALRFTG